MYAKSIVYIIVLTYIFFGLQDLFVAGINTTDMTLMSTIIKYLCNSEIISMTQNKMDKIIGKNESVQESVSLF